MKKADWVGRYVRLREPMVTNHGAMFERGEVMLVNRNFGGLHLEAVRACPECRRRYRHAIRKVCEHRVELLPADYRPEDS
jgi:hypothetical protein